MEIIIQDTSIHARMFLVGQYSDCVALGYDASTIKSTASREIAIDYISFRPSDITGKWIAKRADYPDLFDRCPYTQTTKFSHTRPLTFERWELAIGEADYQTSLERPEKDGNIGGIFNCRTGLIACLRAMDIPYDASDFRLQQGTRYRFG